MGLGLHEGPHGPIEAECNKVPVNDIIDISDHDQSMMKTETYYEEMLISADTYYIGKQMRTFAELRSYF